MKELINDHSFAVALAIVAGVLAIVGLGVLAWARGGRRPAAQPIGVGLTAAGLALWLLWLVYGRMLQHFGMDSVKGLSVNIAAFVIVGATIGALLGVWQRRRTG